MNIDLVIFILLIIGILMGYRRGFVLQVIHLCSFIVSYFVAYRFFREVSPHLQSWVPYPFANQEVGSTSILQWFNVESLFYSVLAFALLFFGTRIALKLIGRLLHLVTFLPVLNFANRWLGAVLGFVEVLIILLIVIHVLLFIPWETGHLWLLESKFAYYVVQLTPISHMVPDLWQTGDPL
ncbi:CvpA family protein [Caldalkalibacillus mannanilyticus]|uniref:CvpA family protein n=1 Tax=Caldalkalibacillus mannanilyticus TaxID=1418 RepID=UPI00055318D7|nr:CvpA family protein [Caldalkalibacillus mannanilyticus]